MINKLKQASKEWKEKARKQVKETFKGLVREGIFTGICRLIETYMIEKPLQKIIKLCDDYGLDKDVYVPNII